jgi:hypothetical protein
MPAGGCPAHARTKSTQCAALTCWLMLSCAGTDGCPAAVAGGVSGVLLGQHNAWPSAAA